MCSFVMDEQNTLSTESRVSWDWLPNFDHKEGKDNIKIWYQYYHQVNCSDRYYLHLADAPQTETSKCTWGATRDTIWLWLMPFYHCCEQVSRWTSWRDTDLKSTALHGRFKRTRTLLLCEEAVDKQGGRVQEGNNDMSKRQTASCKG